MCQNTLSFLVIKGITFVFSMFAANSSIRLL